jgi:hypothetical protein
MKLFAKFLFVAAWLVAGSVALAEDAPVSGVFKGNGKEAKLAYITAVKGDSFMDKPTIVLVLTEKDHSKDAKPRIGAMFGRFGSALIVTVMPDGKIIGCEVAHQAHEKSGFSSIGNLKMSDFKLDGGKVSGKLSTDGEVKTFGQTWEVKVEFQTKAP